MSDATTNFEPLIEQLFQNRSTAVARDLKLNLKKVLDAGALDQETAALSLLAVATALASPALAEIATSRAKSLGLSDELIQEAKESAAIMGMLNKYYRFRHFIEATQGKEVLQQNFRAAGLRMNSLSKPAVGKLRHEMLAFAVSIVNGCETCVTAHEQELRKGGADAELIHDLARLASVASGVAVLIS